MADKKLSITLEANSKPATAELAKFTSGLGKMEEAFVRIGRVQSDLARLKPGNTLGKSYGTLSDKIAILKRRMATFKQSSDSVQNSLKPTVTQINKMKTAQKDLSKALSSTVTQFKYVSKRMAKAGPDAEPFIENMNQIGSSLSKARKELNEFRISNKESVKEINKGHDNKQQISEALARLKKYKEEVAVLLKDSAGRPKLAEKLISENKDIIATGKQVLIEKRQIRKEEQQDNRKYLQKRKSEVSDQLQILREEVQKKLQILREEAQKKREEVSKERKKEQQENRKYLQKRRSEASDQIQVLKEEAQKKLQILREEAQKKREEAQKKREEASKERKKEQQDNRKYLQKRRSEASDQIQVLKEEAKGKTSVLTKAKNSIGKIKKANLALIKKHNIAEQKENRKYLQKRRSEVSDQLQILREEAQKKREKKRQIRKEEQQENRKYLQKRRSEASDQIQVLKEEAQKKRGELRKAARKEREEKQKIRQEEREDNRKYLQKRKSEASAQLQILREEARAKRETLGQRIKTSAKNFVPYFLVYRLGTRVLQSFTEALRDSVNRAMDFESQMARANTIAGPFKGSIEDVSQSIREMSASMGIDAVDNAKAFYNVLSAGFKDNPLVVLKASQKAAIAGYLNVETAIKGTTAVLNIWNREVKDSHQINNVLFKGVDQGVFVYEGLVNALSKVGQTSKNVGITFEETVGLLAASSKSTQNASVSATELRAAIIAMLKPGEEMQFILKSLGAETGEQLVESLGSGAAAFQAIRMATEEYGMQIAKVMGRKQALNGILSLTNENFQRTGEVTAKVKDEQDLLNDAYDKAADTLDRNWKRWAELATLLGEQGVLPILNTLNKAFLSNTTDMEKWTKAIKEAGEEWSGYLKLFKLDNVNSFFTFFRHLPEHLMVFGASKAMGKKWSKASRSDKKGDTPSASYDPTDAPYWNTQMSSINPETEKKNKEIKARLNETRKINIEEAKKLAEDKLKILKESLAKEFEQEGEFNSKRYEEAKKDLKRQLDIRDFTRNEYLRKLALLHIEYNDQGVKRGIEHAFKLAKKKLEIETTTEKAINALRVKGERKTANELLGINKTALAEINKTKADALGTLYSLTAEANRKWMSPKAKKKAKDPSKFDRRFIQNQGDAFKRILERAKILKGEKFKGLDKEGKSLGQALDAISEDMEGVQTTGKTKKFKDRTEAGAWFSKEKFELMTRYQETLLFFRTLLAEQKAKARDADKEAKRIAKEALDLLNESAQLWGGIANIVQNVNTLWGALGEKTSKWLTGLMHVAQIMQKIYEIKVAMNKQKMGEALGAIGGILGAAAGIAGLFMHKGGPIQKLHAGGSPFGGMSSNEVPIIAERGEFMFSKRAVDNLGGQGNVARMHQNAVSGGQQAGSNVELNVSFDPDNFRNFLTRTEEGKSIIHNAVIEAFPS